MINWKFLISILVVILAGMFFIPEPTDLIPGSTIAQGLATIATLIALAKKGQPLIFT